MDGAGLAARCQLHECGALAAGRVARVERDADRDVCPHIGPRVDRHRDAQLPARRQQAQAPVGQPALDDHRPDRLPKAPVLLRPVANRPVDHAVRLLRHAEGTVGECGRDVFRRRAHEGQLEIMDDAGAVHGDRGDDLALEHLNEERAQTHFDDMRAEHPQDGLAPLMGGHDGIHHRAQISGGEDVGKRLVILAEGGALTAYARKTLDVHLAFARADRVGLKLSQIEGWHVQLALAAPDCRRRYAGVGTCRF